MSNPVIIDLSEFNNVTDFAQVARNVTLIIIRVGYRYSVDAKIKYDKKYNEYLAAVKKYNVPYSFYFVSQAITTAEAKEEALFVAAEAKKNITTYHVPVFVDTERINGHSRGDVMSTAQRTQCIKTFCDTLRQQGVPSGIYANLSWLNNNLDMKQLPYPVWMAEYGPRDTYHGEHIMWQYTSKGSIPGISGYVDISRVANTTSEPDKNTSTNEINRVLAVEEAEVGYLEKSSNSSLDSKGSNAGYRNYTKYWRDLYPSYQGQPWCAAFQCWSMVKALGTDRAKQLLLGEYSYYCPTLVNRYKKAGQWSSSPAIGDFIFFKNTSGVASHIGMVRAVDSSRVYTIEGNTSSASGVVANGGGVFEKSYPLSYGRILGYGRPAYSGKAAQSVTIKQDVQASSSSAAAPAKEFNRELAGTYVVTASKLNMRANAGTGSPILAVLSNGNLVNNYGYYSVDSDGTKWLYVAVGDYTGYVSNEWLRRA